MTTSAYAACAPGRITIIDDDEDVRFGLEALLCGAGHEVTAFERADRALLELEQREPPDVIVLDLMMPGMNGWQFRVEQKKHQKLRDVPVIALSADHSSYAQAVDADAYVSKPVDPEGLQAVIARVLLEQERRRLLMKSMELERIRALGTLVASVAHEINNPLTYVSGCLELASAQARALCRQGGAAVVALASALTENLADALDGAARIGSVVQLLSTFSRADTPEAAPVDAVRAVRAASRIARHQVTGNISYHEELKPLPHVVGNEGRLAQVVLNLLVNAAQAVASRAQGAVRVATRVEDASVLIEVSDTGSGIDPDLHERIFEPFFTTKPAGEGTGLGLTIARDIVRDMGGTLSFQSVMGEGTTFVVRLPIAGASRQRSKPDASSSQRAALSSMVRRILVIDDEPMVARLLAQMLSCDIVDVTHSPREALSLSAAGQYDVILCDFYMPEMTGVELYRKLSKLRPDLQRAFVLMTGFHSHPEVESFVRDHGIRLLQKPFSVQALEDCLGPGAIAVRGDRP